jgi:hypothetical protein
MTRLAGFSWLASVDGAVVLQEKDVGVTTSRHAGAANLFLFFSKLLKNSRVSAGLRSEREAGAIGGAGFLIRVCRRVTPCFRLGVWDADEVVWRLRR